MVSSKIEKINAETFIKERVDAFTVGDTVNVHVKITEGGKERVQVFNGAVIARDGEGSNETFTVHRISHGVKVERIFPVHSQHIDKIEVQSSANVCRAKLYYLRELKGKKARLKAARR